MIDWRYLEAQTKIDAIISLQIQKTGRIPAEVTISNCLLADLFTDNQIDVEYLLGGHPLAKYKGIYLRAF